MNRRPLTLAAAAVVLTFTGAAPAYALTAEECSSTDGCTVSTPLTVEFHDDRMVFSDRTPVFQSRTVAPGTSGVYEVTLTNQGTLDHDVQILIDANNATGDDDVYGDPAWTESTILSWISSVDGAASTSVPVAELEAEDGGPKQTEVYSGTLKPGQPVTVTLDYDVPFDSPENAGNAANVETTGFSAELLVRSNVVPAPEPEPTPEPTPTPTPEETAPPTDIDTGSGPGWFKHFNHPFAWGLAALGAAATALALTTRSLARSSAPKETSL